jgi:ADP-heptose:LPS heptosyltransferase
MTPRNNLGLQASLIAHADRFISTCGGLAWVAPLMGTPTTAVYEDDRLLTQHLLIARQAGRRAGAAEFGTLDLREYLRFV